MAKPVIPIPAPREKKLASITLRIPFSLRERLERAARATTEDGGTADLSRTILHLLIPALDEWERENL